MSKFKHDTFKFIEPRKRAYEDSAIRTDKLLKKLSSKYFSESNEKLKKNASRKSKPATPKKMISN